MEMVDKVEAIVSYLALVGESTVSAVAQHVDEPVSSVYRLLSSLVRVGWVSAGTRRGLYRLGLFFLRVGVQVENGIDIRERALPALRRAVEETGQTAFLCVRHDLRAVCIERVAGGDVRSLALWVGGTLPLVIGGAPRALLAYLPEEEVRDVVERSTAEKFAEAIPADARAIRVNLEAVRTSGVSVSEGDVTPGVAAVGAPVFNHRGEVQAALSVSGVRENILGERRSAVIESVRSCASEASRALGWQGEVVR